VRATERYDIVICGFGGAGAAAALEADAAGARVLVLEKRAVGGGSTKESGGSIGSIVKREGAIEHYLALTQQRTPQSVITAYVEGALVLRQWIEQLGASFEALPMRQPPFPRRYAGSAYHRFPGAEAIGPRVRVHEAGVDHGGTSLWNCLTQAVTRAGIEVRYQTAASRLLSSPAGVHGVEATTPDGVISIEASAVILTCGGFNYDPALQRDSFGVVVPSLAPPGANDGAGIRMAQTVGASLWHMNAMSATFGYQFPGYEAAFYPTMPSFGFFLVDQDGRRYLDERTLENHAAGMAMLVWDYQSGRLSRIPSYFIFDNRTRRAGPVFSTEAGENRNYPWSPENQVEVEKGWIKQGPTLAALAQELGLPAAALEEAGRRYNAASASGGDEFGRDPDEMDPVDEPPFYGVPVHLALFNTQGGPRRNEHAQVLHVEGHPIPGLYAAGELGSIWASLYPGAGNVTEALVFGRIAGRHAAEFARAVSP
jgi:succinate dehydrogenase/fumarate reductase flavoprotein subunit